MNSLQVYRMETKRIIVLKKMKNYFNRIKIFNYNNILILNYCEL